jgi:hypothetical protein
MICMAMESTKWKENSNSVNFSSEFLPHLKFEEISITAKFFPDLINTVFFANYTSVFDEYSNSSEKNLPTTTSEEKAARYRSFMCVDRNSWKHFIVTLPKNVIPRDSLPFSSLLPEASENHVVVSSVSLRLFESKVAIHHVATWPKLQRKGLGKFTMKSALDKACDMLGNFSENLAAENQPKFSHDIFLQADPPGMALYRSLGFTEFQTIQVFSPKKN